MSNLRDVKPQIKTITLNDGVEREIRFTLNALAELEERYGSVDAAFAALDNNSIKALRCVLWAALQYSDDSLTERQVGNLIDLGCARDIMDTLGEALSEAMPDESADASSNVTAEPQKVVAYPNK